MSDNLRQTLSIVTFFGGFTLIYLAYGVSGLFLAGLGLCICWACIGLATGYWCGTDGNTERMVTELMRWKRSNGRSASHDQSL
jgi:hypothetical protein